MPRPPRRPAPDARDLALRGAERDVFARFLPRAALVLLDRVRLVRVLRRVAAKLSREGGMARVRKDVAGLAHLVAAYASKQYTDVPWRSVVYALGALLYFLSPLDLVPDFIPFVGYSDDVAVVFAVLKAVRRDLDRFERWQARATAARPEAGEETAPRRRR